MAAVYSRLVFRDGDGVASIAAIVGSNLERILAKKGKTQRWLASEVGVTHGMVSQWVNGRALPGQDKWDAIVKVLEISYVDLVRDPNDPTVDDLDSILNHLARARGFELIKKK